MDPIILPTEIPLQSFKILLDWYKGRHEKIDNELLAAALTVVGFCGVEALPLIGADLPRSDDQQQVDALEGVVAGSKQGLIPWEKIARAVVDEVFNKIFTKS
jgi:hypothetical protein